MQASRGWTNAGHEDDTGIDDKQRRIGVTGKMAALRKRDRHCQPTTKTTNAMQAASGAGAGFAPTARRRASPQRFSMAFEFLEEQAFAPSALHPASRVLIALFSFSTTEAASGKQTFISASA